MHFTMNIPGLEDVNITNIEQVEDRVALHVELDVRPHRCPHCQAMTKRIHDYRIQKIKHLKWFERLTFLFYKKRRYVCLACGKKFAERNAFGFRNFERARAKILLTHKYKNIGVHVG